MPSGGLLLYLLLPRPFSLYSGRALQAVEDDEDAKGEGEASSDDDADAAATTRSRAWGGKGGRAILPPSPPAASSGRYNIRDDVPLVLLDHVPEVGGGRHVAGDAAPGPGLSNEYVEAQSCNKMKLFR